MWLQDTYEGFSGKYWQLPPRKVLPKPWKKPHPPMWYAAGNPPSYAMAARKGLGVLGFSVGSYADLEKVLGSYKSEIVNAEPIGAFVNDNIMVASGFFVAEDTDTAVERAVNARLNYMQSHVFRYHDTFPAPAGIPKWPDVIPDFTADQVKEMAKGGMICGNPDEALAQCREWESTGADQLAFGMGTASHEENLDMIRLMGEYVIPKIDTDPMHRSSRFRDAAAAS
jgi:alkanesulfonate monooxygenase SsuD/methylene tetrahydromethanopterin reductase-like flavin-dependent oxidoreductase (luciferase family)